MNFYIQYNTDTQMVLVPAQSLIRSDDVVFPISFSSHQSLSQVLVSMTELRAKTRVMELLLILHA